MTSADDFALVDNRRRSLPVTKSERDTVQPLPPMKFHYSTTDFHFVLPFDASPSGNDGGKFDKLLLSRWNESKRSGSLQYELNLLYKTLPGRFGLSAQLNMERATHRRKPHSFRNINEPFDSRRFNFTKIRPDEILFEFSSSSPAETPQSTVLDASSDGAMTACHASSSSPTSGRSVIIVNNSPIEKGHSLLVPFIDNCLPQRITYDSIKLAVEVMLLSSCRLFFLVYNSLLGHASVNHLHFHLYYWPYVSRIITWPISQLSGSLFALDGWLIPGFVLQLQNDDVESFSRKIIALVNYFHEKLIAHNLFMARAPHLSLVEKAKREHAMQNHVEKATAESSLDSIDGGDRRDEALRKAPLYLTVYIFPRKAAFGAKPTMNFTPAACECAGHLLIYTSSFFQAIHEARIVHIVEEEAFLQQGISDELQKDLKTLPVFSE